MSISSNVVRRFSALDEIDHAILTELSADGRIPNNALAERVRLAGTRPDGLAVTLESGFYVRGTRVYQASVIGPRPDPEAVATFFESLALRP